jgi:hypothetical protein
MKIDLPSARRVFAMAPHIAELGIEPVEIGDGHVVTALTIERKHLQHSGVDAKGERSLVIKASATMALMPLPPQVRTPG